MPVSGRTATTPAARRSRAPRTRRTPCRPPTSVVLPLAPTIQGPPTIVGTVAQGQVLSEHRGQWSASPTGYTQQWDRCDGAGQNCGPIPGASGESYVPQAADIGHALVVVETASNAGGTGGPVPSAPTGQVPAARGADILATTYLASSLTWQSALLRGVLYTQSAPAAWQFQYG